MTFRLSHLAILLALTTVVTAVGGIVATYRIAGDEFRDVLDDDLEAQADLLVRLLAAPQVDPAPRELAALLRRVFDEDNEETLWVNIYGRDGQLLASNLKHALPLASRDNDDIRVRFDGHDWQGQQRRRDDLVVQLLRRNDFYAGLEDEILEDIITPALIGNGITLLLLATLIGLFLWPLSRLVRQLESRSADSLEPVELRTPATEIAVLRDTLNSLMAGVDDVLKREREFVGDVAHELRTPLTTLKLELASGEPDLPALRAEVDRLARLVAQLLTLARLEGGSWREKFAALDLAALCVAEVGQFRDGFAAAGMTLSGDLLPVTVTGDVPLLQTLLQNLLRNVLNHCPPGTRAEVRTGLADGVPFLEVVDTGPGIASVRRHTMTGRFSRLDSKGEGLGLGLAICHKVAQAHRAEMTFLDREDGAAGLRVRVLFSESWPESARTRPGS